MKSIIHPNLNKAYSLSENKKVHMFNKTSVDASQDQQGV